MTTKDTAEPGVRAAFAAQLQAMTAHDTVALGALLGEEMTLTQMGGHLQPRAEWLGEIGRGLFVYHDIDVESVTVEVAGRTAHLVGRTRTDATVYGARSTWPLQLAQDYRSAGDRWLVSRSVATTW